ncbi:hypothetical protein WJ438_20355 [Streptomyces sp. GD-15H]
MVGPVVTAALAATASGPADTSAAPSSITDASVTTPAHAAAGA